MSEEELQKAIEIMTQPITVNCVDHHYFDQENYDKLASASDSSLWLLKPYESILKENQQLKELINGIREERDYLFNKSSVENKQIQQEKDLYKSVIEEVREYIEKNLSFCENDSQGLYEKCNIRIASDKKLLQILDKAKEVK